MVIQRGDIWRATLPKAMGSHPSGRRPVLVIQSNNLNNSRINTVVIAVLTSNVKLGQAPSNIYLKAKATGLDRDSIMNASQLFTIDKVELEDFVCTLPPMLMEHVDTRL